MPLAGLFSQRQQEFTTRAEIRLNNETSAQKVAYAVLEGHPNPADRMTPEYVEALSRQSVS